MEEVKRMLPNGRWQYRLAGRWLDALEAVAYVMGRTNSTATAAYEYLNTLSEVKHEEA